MLPGVTDLVGECHDLSRGRACAGALGDAEAQMTSRARVPRGCRSGVDAIGAPLSARSAAIRSVSPERGGTRFNTTSERRRSSRAILSVAAVAHRSSGEGCTGSAPDPAARTGDLRLGLGMRRTVDHDEIGAARPILDPLRRAPSGQCCKLEADRLAHRAAPAADRPTRARLPCGSMSSTSDPQPPAQPMRPRAGRQASFLPAPPLRCAIVITNPPSIPL